MHYKEFTSRGALSTCHSNGLETEKGHYLQGEWLRIHCCVNRYDYTLYMFYQRHNSSSDSFTIHECNFLITALDKLWTISARRSCWMKRKKSSRTFVSTKCRTFGYSQSFTTIWKLAEHLNTVQHDANAREEQLISACMMFFTPNRSVDACRLTPRAHDKGWGVHQ